MSKLAQKIRRVPDDELTQRIRSKVTDDALDDIWIAIAMAMDAPSRIFHPVRHHIEEETEAAE